jgi:uncharacterized protein YukE
MSLLFEDASELHAIAHRIRSHADALRTRATELAARADNAHWHSPGSAVFRDRVRQVTTAMRSAAGRLDDAAAALDRHADRVHHVARQLELLAAGPVAEGAQLVDDIGDLAGSALHLVGL